MVTGAFLPPRFGLLVTGSMNPMMRQHKPMTSTLQQPNRQRRPVLLEDADEEPKQFNNSFINHVARAINNLDHTLQREAAHGWKHSMHGQKLRGSKNKIL